MKASIDVMATVILIYGRRSFEISEWREGGKLYSAYFNVKGPRMKASIDVYGNCFY